MSAPRSAGEGEPAHRADRPGPSRPRVPRATIDRRLDGVLTQAEHGTDDALTRTEARLRALQPPAPTGLIDDTTGHTRGLRERLLEQSAYRRTKRPGLVVAAVLLGVLALSGGTAMAAQSALPGDVLYGVKRATERFMLALESDPEREGSLHVRFALRRLAEAEARPAAYESLVDEALEDLVVAQDLGADTQPATAQAIATLDRLLGGDLPATASDAARAALERARARMVARGAPSAPGQPSDEPSEPRGRPTDVPGRGNDPGPSDEPPGGGQGQGGGRPTEPGNGGNGGGGPPDDPGNAGGSVGGNGAGGGPPAGSGGNGQGRGRSG